MTSPEPYQDQVAKPKAKAPATVRLAAIALLAIAALMLGQLVVALYEVITLGPTVSRVAAGTGATASEIQHFKSDQSSYALFYCGLMIFLVGFLTLASFNSRIGRRSGQVLAIIYAAPLVFCSLVPFLPDTQSRLEVAFDNAEPGWAVVIDYATYAVSPLALLVIVLMLSRSARRHFSWLPPAPAGYMWAPSQIPWPYEGQRDR